MNRTAKRSFANPSLLVALALVCWGGFASALTPVLFTGTETNAQLMRIITLTVVPPSGEQLRNTNIVVQPNVTVKPTTNGYPIIELTSADYDVYLAGIKQSFRIAVPDTNVLCLWNLLLKDGLTTYNYTNPLPVINATNVVAQYTTIITTNLFVTTNYNNTSFITNLFVSVEYVTNLFTTNLVAGTITNNTFINTNVTITFLTTNNTFVNTNLSIFTTTNYFNTSITTNAYFTNITATTITNNTFITTNVTVNQPGGLTNLNAVPLTLAFWDINDALTGIPNGVGVPTNNGTGGIGWSSVLSLDEVDTRNFYPTNLFTGLINYPVLGTDGDGKLVLGTATITLVTSNFSATFITNNIAYITNLYTSTAFITNLYVTTNYVNTSFITNLYVSTAYITNLNVTTNIFNTSKGGTVIITNQLTVLQVPNNSILATDGAHNVTNAGLAARFTFTGNVLDIASASIPNADLANSSITVAGTANQVSVSGGGPVSLGGTATLSLPSILLAPGTVAVTGFTNSANSASQFKITDANKGEQTTLDGSSLTNLTIRYDTNSIPSSGALTFGHAYFTNLQASVTLPAFTLGSAAYYESLVICVTNSTGSTTTLTMPSGVKVALANGGGNLIYCTNGTRTMVFVDHYGTVLTNAWKNDF